MAMYADRLGDFSPTLSDFEPSLRDFSPHLRDEYTSKLSSPYTPGPSQGYAPAPYPAQAPMRMGDVVTPSQPAAGSSVLAGIGVGAGIVGIILTAVNVYGVVGGWRYNKSTGLFPFRKGRKKK
jgi:hypothetical protein